MITSKYEFVWYIDSIENINLYFAESIMAVINDIVN